MNKGITVGLDLGDRYSHICVLDNQGEILEEGRVRTTEAALRRKFGTLEACTVALAVCGPSPWTSRLL